MRLFRAPFMSRFSRVALGQRLGRGISLLLLPSAAAIMVLVAVVVRAQTQTPATMPSRAAIGMNLEGLYDWSGDMMFADAWQHHRKYTTDLQTPWHQDNATNVPVDANGWPTVTAFACVIAANPAKGTYNWAGVYHFVAEGNVMVAASGWPATVSNLRYDATTKQTTATITAPSGQGGLGLAISNYTAGAKIHLYRPGYSANDTFTYEFLSAIRPYAVLRDLDYSIINDQPVGLAAADYVLPGQDNAHGGARAHLYTLANQTKKALWLCVPYGAKPDYVAYMAADAKAKLDPSIVVYVEYGNELWNMAFPPAQHLLADAQAEVAANAQSDLNYDSSNNKYQWAERLHARLAVQNADVWNAVFRGRPGKIRHVYGGQFALGDGGWNVFNVAAPYLDQKLKCKFAEVFYAAAFAPYCDDINQNQTTLDATYAAIQAQLPKVLGWSQNCRNGCNKLGVKCVAYEARIGTNNDGVFAAFQSDPRTGRLVTQYLTGLSPFYDDINWYALCSGNMWASRGCITQASVTSSGIDSFANGQ